MANSADDIRVLPAIVFIQRSRERGVNEKFKNYKRAMRNYAKAMKAILRYGSKVNVRINRSTLEIIK